MKRALIFLLGAASVAAAAVVFMLLRPDIGARVFFGIDRSPVEIRFKPNYEVPATDNKTVAF